MHFFGKCSSSRMSQCMHRCACANGSFNRFFSPWRFHVWLGGSWVSCPPLTSSTPSSSTQIEMMSMTKWTPKGELR